jgi:hypothetical protein
MKTTTENAIQRATLALKEMALAPRPTPVPGGWSRNQWLEAILAAAAGAGDQAAIGYLSDMLEEAPWEGEEMAAYFVATGTITNIQWLRVHGRVKRYRHLAMSSLPAADNRQPKKPGGGEQRTIDRGSQGKKKDDDGQR